MQPPSARAGRAPRAALREEEEAEEAAEEDEEAGAAAATAAAVVAPEEPDAAGCGQPTMDNMGIDMEQEALAHEENDDEDDE